MSSPSDSHPRPRGFQPRVERLEARELLDASTPPGRFVDRLYREVLRRAASPGEIAGWQAALGTGGNRAAVVQAFLNSPEYRTVFIEAEFRALLDREPGRSEIDAWLARMNGGMTEQGLIASFIASPEYLARQGHTASGWVKGAFWDVFGRLPEASTTTIWSNLLTQGVSRLTLALNIVNSVEAHRREVSNNYQHLLGRNAEAGAMGAWGAALDQGLSTRQLIAGIAASEEYYTRPGSVPFAYGGLPGLIGHGGAGGQIFANVQGPTRSVHRPGVRDGSPDGGGTRDTRADPPPPPTITPVALGPGGNVNTSRPAGTPLGRFPTSENETTLSINPTNPNQVFVGGNLTLNFEIGGFPTGDYVSFSPDGGQSWFPRPIGDGTTFLPTSSGDLFSAWDTFGNLFLVYLTTLPGGLSGVAFLVSINGGATFTLHSIIAPHNNQRVLNSLDQPKVAVGNGMVWVSFQMGDAVNVVAATGAAVTGLGRISQFRPIQVMPASTQGNFGHLAIGPNGEVAVAWQALSNPEGPDGLFVSTDPDGLGPAPFGLPCLISFTGVGGFFHRQDRLVRPLLSDNDLGFDAEIRLSWDRSDGPFRGRLYAVYTDLGAAATANSDDTDILFRASDDKGRSWGNPVRLNDDFGGDLTQILPFVAVDQSTGAVAAVWFDARRDFVGGPADSDFRVNTDAEQYMTASCDGGRSFARNVVISARSSNAALEPQPPFLSGSRRLSYGDYRGADFHRGRFLAAWPDNSNSTGDNPNLTPPATPLGFFDIYVGGANVVCPPGSVPPPPSGRPPFGDDDFEPNDTSDRARLLGVVNGTPINVAGLNINTKESGLPDNDWFRFTTGRAGLLTVDVRYLPAVPRRNDLQLRLFTLGAGGSLIEIGTPSSLLIGGLQTQRVVVPVPINQPILVWVFGIDGGQNAYDLTATVT